MAIYPTIKSGGGNVEYAIESALGTPGSYLDMRLCEDSDPTFPTDTREVRPVSAKGHWDPAEREAQLSYEKFIENAISLSTYVAGCSSAAGTPQVVSLFEAMGCTIVAGSNTATVLDAYSSTTAWSGGAGSPTAGQVGLIANKTPATPPTAHYMYLTYTNSGAANYDMVPTMALPAASESAAEIHNCWTITPPKGSQVSSSKTLAFRVSSYHATSTETGSCHIYTGCAPGEVKPIVFESGSPIKTEWSLHCADRAFDQSGIDLTAATYVDSVKIPFIDGSGTGFLFGFCDTSAMPIAATRTTGFRKATWNPGIKTIPIMETGTTTAVNGLGGYLGVYTGSTLELVMDVNKDWWTALESSGSQTAKYVELVQNVAATTSTACGLWMPKCYMTGKPVADLWSDKEMTVTVTLEAASAGMTVTSKTAAGNQPWYFAVSPVH